MSWWTHVTGVFEVDTYKTNESALAEVYSVISTLPKITGSEGDCKCYVNLREGHNWSTWDRNGRSINGQSRVLITVFGNLRDRTGIDTAREVVNFIDRLSKKLSVNYATCTVTHDLGIIDCVGNWNLCDNYVWNDDED